MTLISVFFGEVGENRRALLSAVPDSIICFYGNLGGPAEVDGGPSD